MKKRRHLRWPKHYRIGYRIMRLVSWDRDESRTCQLSGRTNTGWGITQYCSDRAVCEQANTILHEVIHNILTTAQYDVGDDTKEETIIQCIANGLCTFAYQNRHLWRKLGKAVKV